MKLIIVLLLALLAFSGYCWITDNGIDEGARRELRQWFHDIGVEID